MPCFIIWIIRENSTIQDLMEFIPGPDFQPGERSSVKVESMTHIQQDAG